MSIEELKTIATIEKIDIYILRTCDQCTHHFDEAWTYDLIYGPFYLRQGKFIWSLTNEQLEFFGFEAIGSKP